VPKSFTLVRVFVASPGDVADERKAVADAINQLNLSWSESNNIRIELVTWETHTRPGFGDSPQDVINRQIGDDYDIFVGVMWSRFGTVTSSGASGTEEEFRRAYTRLTASEDIEMMFYFKDAGLPLSQIDPAQLAKVHAFKQKISSEYGGLYHEFTTGDEFRTQILIHLSKAVQEILRKPSHKSASPSAPEKTSTELDDPLTLLSAMTDEDYGEGIIELSERANDAMAVVIAAVTRMVAANAELTQQTTRRTDELKAITASAASTGGQPDSKALKRVANATAGDLDLFVQRTSAEIPIFRENLALAMETFGKMALISAVDFVGGKEELEASLVHLIQYRATTVDAIEGVSRFKETIAHQPRMTTPFNHARKRAVNLLDEVIGEYRSAGNVVTETIELIRRILGDNIRPIT